LKGIRNVNKEVEVHIIPKESEAIDFALSNARKDSFITIISDVIPEALDQVKALKEQEGSVF
jgi:cyanophycin synthetase